MVTKRGTNVVHGSARYFYAPEPLADGEHARGGQPRRPVDQPHERPPRLRRRGGWGRAFRPPVALGRLGQEPDRPPEARPARLGGPPGRTRTPRSRTSTRGSTPSSAASNSLELYYHHGDRVQYGRGVDINTAPEAGFDLTQPVPIYKIADTQVFSSEPDGDGLLFLHGLRADRDAGRGRRHAGLYRSEQRAAREHASFAEPLDRPAGRGLGLEVLYDREPLARAQGRIRIPVRDDRCLVSDGPGDRSTATRRRSIAYITRAAVGTTQEQRLGVFVSDTLTSDRLTVSAGVRYDYGRARNAAAFVPGQPAVPGRSSGGPVRGRRGLPDLGGKLAAARGRDLRTRARSDKRCCGPRTRGLPTSFSTGSASRALSPRSQAIYYYWTDTNANHRVDPGEVDFNSLAGFYNVDPANPGAASAPNQISPNLRPTTVDEFVVGADQELFAGLTASIHYTYRSIRGDRLQPLHRRDLGRRRVRVLGQRERLRDGPLRLRSRVRRPVLRRDPRIHLRRVSCWRIGRATARRTREWASSSSRRCRTGGSSGERSHGIRGRSR